MNMTIYNHLDGKKDKRYGVSREYTSEASQYYVARFCGEWIGSADSAKDAWELAQEHYDNHKIDAVYKEGK